jgi:hypothetical protein
MINATTGQIVRELTLNPDIDYQGRGIRKQQSRVRVRALA